MWKIKDRALELRRKGLTYTEINRLLGTKIPKGTLSGWCKKICLSKESKEILRKKIANHLVTSRAIAHEALRKRRVTYLAALDDKNLELISSFIDPRTAKLVLHALFLGEGFKKKSGNLAFGNSDQFIIRLYLKLLRQTYKIKESKLRLTVQCRADQNIKALEEFWCNVTKIPKSQLYKAQIDPRTIGKRTKNTEYKGVCKIDYMVANVYNDMNSLTRVIDKEFLGR